MQISIVIPNYNGSHLLTNNLPAVIDAVEYYKKIHGGGCEIVIVDDASVDDSLQIIENITKKISIPLQTIKNETNKGFSHTVNKGVSLANGDIVILLNTDVKPKKDFLIPLLAHFANENIFAVGCMDESIEHGKTVFRGRGVGEWKKGFLLHSRGNIDRTNTLWVSGGSGAFRKDIWEKLHGLTTLYSPFYWEDIDISYRALKSGYTLVFEPKSIVQHTHETGIIRTTYSKEYITAIAYRNQILFVWLNVTDFLLIVQHILWMPYHIMSAIVHGDSTFLAGFYRAVGKIPLMLMRRGQVQETFTRSDKEIINKLRA